MEFNVFTMLPFMVCLFWTMIFVLDWTRNNAADHVLAVFFTVGTALYFCHALYFNHRGTALSDCVYAFCNIAVFPLYYLYICRLTGSHREMIAKWWVALPAVAIGVWAAVVDFALPADEGAHMVRDMASRILFLVQLAPVCIFGYRRLRNFDLRIANFYSDAEKRSVKQTSRMMFVLVVCSFASALASLIGRVWFAERPSLLVVVSLLFASLLFAVGYVGLHQRFCNDDLEREEHDVAEVAAQAEEHMAEQPEEAEDEASQEATEVTAMLDALMEREKLYCQADLRLADVASRLGIGRTALSRAINSRGVSFSDYISALRVRHAAAIIDEAHDRNASYGTLLELGEQSGFSSESSFYRAFRKHTGMTPSQWSTRRNTSTP